MEIFDAVGLGLADVTANHRSGFHDSIIPVQYIRQKSTNLRIAAPLHKFESDIGSLCKLFGQWSEEAEAMLKPFVAKYGERRDGGPKRLDDALLVKGAQGGSIFTIYGFS
jgi:hypothetical protein